jgi:hypothetical protein
MIGLGLSAVVALTAALGAAAQEGEFSAGEETYAGDGYGAVKFVAANRREAAAIAARHALV